MTCPRIEFPNFDNPVLSCCGHTLLSHDYDGCHGKYWNGYGCSCTAHLLLVASRLDQDDCGHDEHLATLRGRRLGRVAREGSGWQVCPASSSGSGVSA